MHATSPSKPWRGLKLSVACALCACSLGAHAYLGGFEDADGYKSLTLPVQYYNAGQYGANSGSAYAGNVYTPQAVNSGLWQITPGSGGSVSNSSIFSSYAIGHPGVDRTWVNSGQVNGSGSDQALVITTSHLGYSGPALQYQYRLDSSDLGVNPSTTGASKIKMSFWWRPELADNGPSGSLPAAYFGDEIALKDSLGHVGFRLGLTNVAGGDQVTYVDGSSGQVQTSIVASSGHQFDRWDLYLDLAADLITADYFEFATSTLHHLVTNAALITNMSDLSYLDIRTSPGDFNAKYMALDDFSFETHGAPEPGSLALVGSALLGLRLARRRVAQADAGAAGAGSAGRSRPCA